MAPNIPEMYEAHFGVPMTGARAELPQHPPRCRDDRLHPRPQRAKVLLVDREFHRVMTRRWRSPRSSRWSSTSTIPSARTAPRSATRPGRSSSPRAMPTMPGSIPPTNGTPCRSTTPRARRATQGRRVPPPWRLRYRPTATPRNGRWATIRSISGRCRCSTATAGAFPGRWRWSPALDLPAPVQRQAIYDSLADQRRHPHVRRADHHAVHHRRAARGAPPARAQGRVHDRGRAAARPRCSRRWRRRISASPTSMA
jgi:hypothetical protein